MGSRKNELSLQDGARWGGGGVIIIINETHSRLQDTQKRHLHATNSLRDCGGDTLRGVTLKTDRGCKMIQHLSLFGSRLNLVFLRMDRLHGIEPRSSHKPSSSNGNC